MSDFTEDFLSETKNHKSVASMGDVIGLPDREDRDRIRRYLLRYENKHPGEVAFHIGMAKEHFKAVGGNRQKYGIVNKQAQGRVLFELPDEIGHWLENAYPLMFRDKKHTAWFAKNFPELLVPEKY